MTDNRRERIETIFDAARRLPATERDVYVDAQCGSDTSLRDEVRQLLAHHEKAEREFTPLDSTPIESSSPKSIDRYKIIRTLGEGGMGTVYLAQQEQPIRRQVALKVIRGGLASEQVLPRFRAEQQALALLDHPSIASVFDTGTTQDGRPYFVMEYVDGEPITDYCDRKSMGFAARIAVFVQVCNAIQHAHQKGIIHRDIKPSNVIVTEHNGVPLPKVIDFGIAKATESGALPGVTLTTDGQLVGTLEYMSPEQAAAIDVDTRTDVYALGLLLYELLVGVLPYDARALRERGLEEMLRTIRESEPPRPSARLSTLGDSATERATRRGTEPRTLARFLRGDVDWIVMKALEKDRDRRYTSAAEFAADLDRFSRGEAVNARPPSAVYQMRVFARRHKNLLAGGIAVLLTLLAGIVVSTSLFLQAERARRESEKRAYVLALRAATADIERNDGQAARRRLQQTSENLRGWEWTHLWNEADRSLGTPIDLSSTGSEYRAAFSHDGRMVALRSTVSDSRPIRLFDTTTGQPVADLPPPSRLASSRTLRLLFSADDRRVAFIGERGEWFQMVDIEAESTLVEISYDRTPGRIVAVDDTFEIAAFYVEGGDIDLIRLPDRQRIRTLSWPAKNVYALSGMFVNDGRFLVVTGYESQPIRVFDTQTGEVVKEFAEQQEILTMASTSGESRLAMVSSSGRGKLRLLDTTDWAERWQTEVPELEAGAVGFASVKGGAQVVAAGRDGIVRFFSIAQGLAFHELRGHNVPVTAFGVRDSDQMLLTAHSDGTVKQWDGIIPLEIRASQVRPSVVFGTEGFLLYAGVDGSERLVAEWNVLRDGPVGALRLFPWSDNHRGVGYSLALSPDGRQLAVASGLGFLGRSGVGRFKVFDLATGRSVAWEDELHLAQSADLTAVAWRPGTEEIALGSSGGLVTFYDVSDRNVMYARSVGVKRINDLAYSPDGSLLAVAADNGTLSLLDPKRFHVVRVLQETPDIGMRALAFSPDGTALASGAADGTVSVWDPATGKLRRQRRAHTASVDALAYLPDANRLISGSADRSAMFLDAESLDELLVERYHSGVLCVAVNTAGDRVAVSLKSGGVFGMDLESETKRGRERRQLQEARQMARSMVRDLFAENGDLEPVVDAVEEQPETANNKTAVRMELYALRDSLMQDAYASAHDVAWPILREYVLRNQLVIGGDPLDFSDLFDAVNAREDLSGLERDAVVEELATLRGAALYRYRGRGNLTNVFASQLLEAPESGPREWALAYFAMMSVVEEVTNRWSHFHTLARAQYQLGLYTDAAASLRRARELNGTESDPTIEALDVLVNGELGSNEDDARARLDRLRNELEIGRATGPMAARARAIRLRRRHQYDDAEKCFRQSLELLKSHSGENSTATLQAYLELGALLDRAGDHAAAEPLFERAMEIALQRFSGPYFWTARAREYLGLNRVYQGHEEEGERLLRQAIDEFATLEGGDHWTVAHARGFLGESLLERARYAEAEETLSATSSYFAGWHPVQFNYESILKVRFAEDMVQLYEKWEQPDSVAHWTEWLQSIAPFAVNASAE